MAGTDMELTDLYSDKIIEIAGNLPVTERLEAPDASARRVSRVCGSSVEVDLSLDDGIVSDYAHEVKACALGQTSASIMAQHIVGSTPDELRTLRTQMVAMLKADGPPPGDKWSDLKYLEPVKAFKPRHTSTLLVFEAVVDCLDQIEMQKAG
ncbi:iron-sulfur cluster assembly scaffold protein [Cucumibacter marinus]|uniref:iron-sulfur cluster assembly scaffold protein n=1 Tax=Cucumibacter marinus TaxID=1121252 RepID=UPI00041C5CD7|nr:iron-sulfur cluster assembly scaffold protein [Cucumibacter marinus]